MKRFLVSGILLAIMAVSLYAGGGNESSAAASGSTIRWAYWGAETRVKISQDAINIYQGKNPGVLVNPEPTGGTGDHFTKVDTQLAGGNGPDIIQMGGNILDYINRDVLLPLNQYAGNLLDTASIDAAAIESGTFNGNLYGVSTGVTMPALVYNKSLLERVGAPLPKMSMTYAEFRDYLVAVKAKLPQGVYPFMDIGALSTNSTPFGYWLRYNGTPIYDEVTGTTDVTAADAQKYLELFKDYRDNGLVPPADVAANYPESNADSSSLIAGTAVITFAWTNQLAGLQAATTDELALIEFPGAAATKALWPAPSQFYTVNKDSKNIEGAVKFINFLVNDPEAALVLGNDRGASSSSTARAAGTSNINDQKVLAYLEATSEHASRETAHLPNDTELNQTLYLIYQQVAFGQSTPAKGGQDIYDMLVRLTAK